MVTHIYQTLRDVPDYFVALRAAVAVFISVFPIYAGLWYFMHQRKLRPSIGLPIAVVGVFVLFSGLAFVLASPLSNDVPYWAIRGYLFVTSLLASYAIVLLVDLFVIQHYISHVHRIYISPPIRLVFRLVAFAIGLLLIMRFVLSFNPLALVAIPTILTAGIALALQDTLKSFIAGIGLGNIMHINQWISFQGFEGRVIDVNWSRTVLETLDGNRVFLPNSLLQNQVILNYTIANAAGRGVFKFGASYEVAPARVKEVVLKTLKDVPHLANVPALEIYATTFGDSAINYSLYFWVTDYVRRAAVQDEIASRLWIAFRQEGIMIPYPTRTLHIVKDPIPS